MNKENVSQLKRGFIHNRNVKKVPANLHKNGMKKETHTLFCAVLMLTIRLTLCTIKYVNGSELYIYIRL